MSAEVADRHVLAVDGAGVAVARSRPAQVRDDLVAVEVEVDPVEARAALRAAQQAAIEAARLLEVADGEGEVEARSGHGSLIDLRRPMGERLSMLLRRRGLTASRWFPPTNRERRPRGRASAS